MNSLLAKSILAAACITSTAAVAQAGLYWNPYWNLDARVSFVPATVSYNVPTGYWYGGYGYTYGGYYYEPFMGSYYGYGSYYPFYSQYYNWYASPYVYGFVDTLRARFTGLVPVTTYWNSWYWDPTGTGYTLDVVSAGDDLGNFLTLPADFPTSFSQDFHTFEVNSSDVSSPYDSGTFGTLQFIPLSDLPAFVSNLPGMTPEVHAQFIASALYQKLTADLGPTGLIGVSPSTPWSFPIPEPSSLTLLALTPLTLRRRH